MMLLTYWKQFAALALFLAGVFIGYSYEKAKFETFVAQVETNGKVAEALAAEKEKRQQAISENITKEYANAVKNLADHYKSKPIRVFNTGAASCSLSKVPNTTSGANGQTESNSASTGGTDTVTEEMCASDVLQLLTLQQWIKQQGD